MGSRLTSRSSLASDQSQDHYSTLGIKRTATPKEIKSQFYALSKKYHPDLNRDDEGAKKRFQEVSEAWNTLGNEKSRRDYDRQLQGGGGGGGMGRRGTAGYSYDSTDNTARRARASYAWEYQRRRSDSNRARAGAARHDPFNTSSSSASASSFHAYAERQRKRESALHASRVANGSPAASSAAAAAAGAGASAASGASSTASAPGFEAAAREHAAQSASALVRFLQVGAAFVVVWVVGSGFAAKGSGNTATSKRPVAVGGAGK
ncbi:DnaJ-domain-containing protein [Jaminaea rosea]|uniref:DnaJ-domain-containing protein n=1 Tax=Jaminaea rosea TaxID=1569628 RepID=A0A316UX74_9BASI|nr:DnaJ-domain-containing protein [Jaminaea rosea]PWN29910.1 DnaJ-domain-containing protein [Jaminaea rosea]